MCDTEQCENSGVSADIADIWEHVGINVDLQRMESESTAATCQTITDRAGL